MDAKEVFEKIREAKSLEVALKDVKPEFGSPTVIRYNDIIEILDKYCKEFSIEKLFQLYDQLQNEKTFAAQYNLLIQSDIHS